MKTKEDGWKTDIKFLLIDVNFHDKVSQNDKGYVAESNDYVHEYFLVVCNKEKTLADFQSFFSKEVQNNVAGKKVRT